ncbi:Penicillin-binding protein 1C [Pillotina sp. SPG140]|jgi:penicillin-binding protein 1C
MSKLKFLGLFIIIISVLFFILPVKLFNAPYSPVLYDRFGTLLGASVARDGQWRFSPVDTLNEKFVTALIEYEDKRFYEHIGIDFAAVLRALWQNIRSKRIVSGASTLSMQTVRLSRAPRPRTVGEKIIEALWALRLELWESKDSIVRLYAAHAPFGANVVGVEAAAWRWFGRSHADLSWAEAATLAVLPNSPGLVHPGRNRTQLRIKRDALLTRLFHKQHFDEETFKLALLEEVPGEPGSLPQTAPHLLARLAQKRAGAFHTTLDGPLQRHAQQVLEEWSARFAESGIDNAACLILDTMSGEVRAYIGNVKTTNAPSVDLVTARRSSGSILKPFLYAAMLDSGDILPTSLVSDIPTRVGTYSPENNSRSYLGVVPADAALARSLNVPAARALQLFGVERFSRLLRTLGVTTLFRSGTDYGLPLILGGAEVTLWEMAGLYAGLARTAAGVEKPLAPPHVETPAPAVNPAFSPAAAWLTVEALTFVTRPAEESLWQHIAASQRIAWKTGTSFGNRDAWAIGVTPEWTVAVWIGNAHGEGRNDLKSISTSAPVLFDLFSLLPRGTDRWFERPPDLIPREVCAYSGYPLTVDCAASKISLVPQTAPVSNPCRFCRTLALNSAGTEEVIVQAGEPVVYKKWFVLPPVEEWYYRQWNIDYVPPPRRAAVSDAHPPLALSSPEEGAQILVPIELDGRPGRVVFSAATRNETVYWHLDEQYLGETRTFHEIALNPPPGPHRITLVDSVGNTVTRRFSIISRPK